MPGNGYDILKVVPVFLVNFDLIYVIIMPVSFIWAIMIVLYMLLILFLLSSIYIYIKSYTCKYEFYLKKHTDKAHILKSSIHYYCCSSPFILEFFFLFRKKIHRYLGTKTIDVIDIELGKNSQKKTSLLLDKFLFFDT